MITYDEVLALGWNDRHPNSNRPKDLILNNTFVFPSEEGFDYHIMGIYKYSEDEDLFVLHIKSVPEDTQSNEWENSECHFYGFIRSAIDLQMVMQMIEVVEYTADSKYDLLFVSYKQVCEENNRLSLENNRLESELLKFKTNESPKN